MKDKVQEVRTRGIKRIPIDQLIPHPDNPRKELGDISELTESIRATGIYQNLTVTPAELVKGIEIPDEEKQYYVIIIGHRRFAAAKAAGLTEVPCMDLTMSREEQIATMLMENVQRCDLTPYEQAQGFHQLALLGLNVAEISRRSGFSTKTVKHRIEMAKLDQKTLKEVSTGRQLSMGDFAKLEELTDMKARNTVLKSIGTRDFNEKLKEAQNKQKANENRPKALQWLKEHNAKSISLEETYGSQYTSYFGGYSYGFIELCRLGKDGNKLPSDKTVNGKQLFYTMKANGASLGIYIQNPSYASKAGTNKKTEEEKARDRVMREVRAKIKELSALHYGLRKDFIEGLTVTKANRDKIVAGALMPALYFAHCSGANKSDTIDKLLGYERSYEYHTDKVLAGLDGLQEKDLARAVYAIYNDNAENWFADDMNTSFTIPNYDPTSCNIMLQLLYRWLESLGYEPSTEEQALRDGSHEIYRRAGKK